ncbi:MAG: hypothetical protein QM713_11040 [Arachnia sp.]
MTNSTRRALAPILLAALLATSACAGVAVPASPPPTAPTTASSGEKTSDAGDEDDDGALEQEQRLREAALPESISPGAFLDGDTLVSRIYADAHAPEGACDVLPSRFTRDALNALSAAVTSGSHAEGTFFGIYYDAQSDTLHVTGNITEDSLPQDALARGELTYEYAAEGGRM